MIILGVDFGDKRMGLAVCDPSESVAVSIGTETVRGAKDAAEKAARAAEERGAGHIVVGMPEREDGYRGERCEKTEFFLGFLKEFTPVPVSTFNERFTTVEAHELLFEAGRKGKDHISCVDALSAQLILEGFLKARNENHYLHKKV